MGWLRGMAAKSLISVRPSPAIMRKRPVGLGHAVRVLALLDGISPAVGCIEQLGREPLRHRLFIALARGCDDPADPERLPAGGADPYPHPLACPADAAPAHFQP